MGFFADIIADSRYNIRRPSSPLARPEVSGTLIPEPLQQSSHLSQSRSRLEARITQDSGLEDPSSRSAKRLVSVQTAQRSHSPEAAPAQSVATPGTQTVLPPIPKVTKTVEGATRIQRKPTATSPTGKTTTPLSGKAATPPNGKAATPTVTKTLGKRRSVPTTPTQTPQSAVATKALIRTEPVHRTNAATLRLNEGIAISHDSSQPINAVSPSPGRGSHSVQNSSPSQQHSSAEEAPSGTVMARAVEQASPTVRQIAPITAEPSHSDMAAKTVLPQVHIGQVNVIVEGSVKSERSPASTRDDWVSRTFLRSL